MSLDKLIHGIESIRVVSPTMPVQHLLVLLTVARHENQEGGLLITDIANKSGMSLPGASRAVRQLSESNRNGDPGLDLVVAETNWSNQRQKLVRLTPRGRAVVNQFVRIVDGGSSGN